MTSSVVLRERAVGIFRRKRVADIREAPQPIRRAGKQSASGARMEFGKPTRCPKCASPGYLDLLDLNRRTMSQHCPTCLHRWEITEADIRRRNDQLPAPKR
ncbi:MAG: hypothetical protein AB7L13_04120 [Acidimicrobiia bacterium]